MVRVRLSAWPSESLSTEFRDREAHHEPAVALGLGIHPTAVVGVSLERHYAYSHFHTPANAVTGVYPAIF